MEVCSLATCVGDQSRLCGSRCSEVEIGWMLLFVVSTVTFDGLQYNSLVSQWTDDIKSLQLNKDSLMQYIQYC